MASCNKYAILIGVNGYHESLGPLSFSVNDARLMRDTLLSELCGFREENVLLLCDDESDDRKPTFGNIHSWIGTWLSQVKADDFVLVYFAGHGRELNGSAFLAPADATLETLSVTGIGVAYIRDVLSRCPASQKVLILDACHSGGGRDVATMSATFREALDQGKGLYTIASCDADEIAYEWPEKKHGLFTHYFVEAIQHGAVPETDGNILLDRVYDWTTSSIQHWTSGKRLKQTPVRISHTQGNIAIASRPLTTEQRLEVAQSQLVTQNDMIAQLRLDIKTLSSESETRGRDSEARIRKSSDPWAMMQKTKRVTVPDRREWIRSNGPFGLDWDPKEKAGAGLPFICAITFVLGAIAGTAVGNFSSSTLGVATFLCIGLGLPCLEYMACVRIWENKYRLKCSRACRDGGDYVQGAAFALAMTRMGVDRSNGGYALLDLAGLAADNGDTDTASILYHKALDYWNSPHAKVALDKLEADDL